MLLFRLVLMLSVMLVSLCSAVISAVLAVPDCVNRLVFIRRTGRDSRLKEVPKDLTPIKVISGNRGDVHGN